MLAEADTILGAVVGMSGSRAGINQARTRLRVEGKSGGPGGGGTASQRAQDPRYGHCFQIKSLSLSVCLSLSLRSLSLIRS